MLAVALIVIIPFEPIDLDTISPRYARHLDGKPVVATFIIGKPPYTWKGSTIIGTDDKPDGIERTAILKRVGLDVKEGKRVRVNGVLRVIDHPARLTGREIVPGWTEIRVEER